MFDIYLGEIELTAVILIFSAILIVPLQFLLCYKASAFKIRLIPIFALSAVLLILLFLSFTLTGINSLACTISAVYSAFLLFSCVIGWIIWLIVKAIKQKNKNRQ